MPQINRTSKARQDSVEIWTYLAEHNELAADKVIAKIDRRLQSLSQMPLSGIEVPYVSPNVRRSSVDRYVIYYRPIENGIEVLRILHERRKQNL